MLLWVIFLNFAFLPGITPVRGENSLGDVLKSASPGGYARLFVDCQRDNFGYFRRWVKESAEPSFEIQTEPFKVIVQPYDSYGSRPRVITETVGQFQRSPDLSCVQTQRDSAKDDGEKSSDNISSGILTAAVGETEPNGVLILISGRPGGTYDETPMLAKNIRFYVLWTGSEANLPPEYVRVTARTNGGIFNAAAAVHAPTFNGGRSDEDGNVSTSNATALDYETSTLLSEKKANGDFRWPVPVEEYQSFIYFVTEGSVTKSLLILPTGVKIDLTPAKVWKMPFEIIETTFKIEPWMVGNWTFVCSGSNFNVHVLTLIPTAPPINDQRSPQRWNDRSQPLNLPNVTERSLDRIDGAETFMSNALKAVLPGPSERVTAITVDLQSTFFAIPGEVANIIFMVRNNAGKPVRYFFRCDVQQYEACYVRPQTLVIGPFRTAPVSVFARSEGSEGSRNLVTFTAQSLFGEQSRKRVYVYVGRQWPDSTKPQISYHYNGDCSDANTGNTCRSKKWSADLSVRDGESGLLNVWSEPGGLIDADFIVGTKEDVTLRYTAFCCEPKVDVTAVDLRGNTYKVYLNVERQYLSVVEIIAIILGIILLILLVIGIIFCIVRWRKKKREQDFLSG